MPYISKEDLEQARRIDLLTYLKTCEPDELVSMGYEKYKLKSHDSLKLSNGKWFWWSHNIGGSTALDYLIRVKGIALPQAVLLLSKECGFFHVRSRCLTMQKNGDLRNESYTFRKSIRIMKE